jgi:hypothetical protein
MVRGALLPLVACLVVSTLSVSCGRRPGDDLRKADAAAGLRVSPAFAAGQNAPAVRQLVEVTAMRRLGSSSTEVEFTWRATPPPTGQTEAPLRTSMALFRLDDKGAWVLTSLYKIK